MRVGRKATGPVERVSRVAKETDNRVTVAGLSVNTRRPGFLWHKNQERRGFMMKGKSEVFTTKEACAYLRISRPTYLKLVHTNQIRARKVGRGWRVLKAELQAYLKIEGKDSLEMVTIS